MPRTPSRTVYPAVLLLLLASGLACTETRAEAPQRPNVLFIVLDDLRPLLGCYGCREIRSPHIDRLAAGGMLFERAYCQQAVCNPSRCSVLSGCRPDTTGVQDNQHFLRPSLPDVVTLPEHFKNHGYLALSLGKIFHHSAREPGDDPQSWSEPSWYGAGGTPNWFTRESLAYIEGLKRLPKKEQPKLFRGFPYEASDEPDDSYEDGQIALKAMETLRRIKNLSQNQPSHVERPGKTELPAGSGTGPKNLSQNHPSHVERPGKTELPAGSGTGPKNRPFFLGVGFHKPHLPFCCPRQYWDLYPAETIKLPDNYDPPKGVPEPALHNGYELRSYGGIPKAGPISDQTALNLIRGYRACVSFVDAQVGRVLDELDRLGLSENTVVLLWGDHGYHLGENGLFTKMTNFELGTRSPLIVRVPGQKTAGQRTAALVEFVDIYPTLAELCGLPLPAHLEGVSLAPLLNEPAKPWKTAAFSQYLRPGKTLERGEKQPAILGRSVRTDRWRYTEWTAVQGDLRGVELYDHRSDPAENVNLAVDAAHAAQAAELAQTLRAGWQAALPPGAKRPEKPNPKQAKAATPRDTPDLAGGDFEGRGWVPWTVTGEAFGPAPFRPLDNKRPENLQGEGLAFSGRLGGEAKGVLLSPTFAIQHRYVNFLIRGQRDLASVLGVELLVDGRTVRSACASEDRSPLHLYWRTWDVGDLRGRSAQIRVNDQSPYGDVTVDAFQQSDEPRAVPCDATVLWHETFRPQFHYTPQAHWMNDPNGLFYYQGQWHLFHQHRHPACEQVVWAHAVSADLFHWRHLPVAFPAGPEGSNFSGSGLIDWHNASGLKQGPHPPILLFYTLHPGGGATVTDPTPDTPRATQNMACSTDGGQSFVKFAGNPILRTADCRDRDPKVLFHAPSRAWIMVLSLSRNNANRDGATYGLFRSTDLRRWELMQEVGPGAWYWECPDLFEMPVEGGPGAQSRWLLVKGSGEYIVGAFDGRHFQPETEPIRNRWGGCYYGVQTFSDAPQGRRVQLGWMSTGKEKRPNSYPGMPFNQQMSVPRELTLRSTPQGPRVFRLPVREIEALRAKTHDRSGRTLSPGENALDAIDHDLLDIELELHLQQATKVKLALRGEMVEYDVKAKRLIGSCIANEPRATIGSPVFPAFRWSAGAISNAEINSAFGSYAPLECPDGRLHLRVLLDRASIEVFANQGAVDMSGVFYPRADNRRLVLAVEGGPAQLARLQVHELRSVWPDAR